MPINWQISEIDKSQSQNFVWLSIPIVFFVLTFDFYWNLSEKPEYNASVSADQKNRRVGRNARRKYQYNKYNLSIDLSTCFPMTDFYRHVMSCHMSPWLLCMHSINYDWKLPTRYRSIIQQRAGWSTTG